MRTLQSPETSPWSLRRCRFLCAVLVAVTASACAPITLAAAEDIPVEVRERQTVTACEEVFELVATPQDELGGIPWGAQRRDVEKSFRAVAVEPRLRERARAFLETADHPLSREAFERFAELVAFCELYVQAVTNQPPDSSESADV